MTQQISASHLVYTKLNQPRVTTQLVERKRLYKALNLQRPLAIVVAPAGYGKTTLVSSWASESSLPCSWLSLNPGTTNSACLWTIFWLQSSACIRM